VVGGSAAEPQGKFAVLGGAVAIVPSCPELALSTALCAGSSAGPYLRIVGDASNPTSGFSANLGSGLPLQAVGAYEAAVSLASASLVMEGRYDANSSASLGGVAMSGLVIRAAWGEPTFAALTGDIVVDSGAANGGFDVLVLGEGRVAIPKLGGWNVPRLSVAYANGGVVVVGSLNNKPKLGDASMSTFAYFGTQQDTTVRVLGNSLPIPPRTYLFVGSMPTPDFLSKHLGVAKQGLGAYATYTSAGLAKITAVVPVGLKLPGIAHVKVAINSFTLTVIVNMEPSTMEIGYQVAANGTMSIDDSPPVAVVLALRYTPFEFTISLSAIGANGGPVWPNIFGVRGLDLDAVAIQLNLTPGVFPYVGIGLAGKGSLPGKLREYMGIDSNAQVPVSFVMNLSQTDPCLSVSVGDPSSSTPIVALPPGTKVLTATYFSLLVSPFGCSVGVFDVPAGVQIRAKVGVLSTSVDFYAAYDRNVAGPPGLPKTPTFRAWLNVDNPGTSDKVRFDGALKITAAAGGWTPAPHVSIRGGIKVGASARIDLFGLCVAPIGCTARGSGSVSVGGFAVSMDLEVTNFPSPFFSVTGSANLKIAGAQVALSGSFQPIKGSYAFSGTGTFPRGPLSSFEVGFTEGIETNYVPKAWFRASGSLGGRFKALADASGRFTTGLIDISPSIPEVTLAVRPNLDLGLITVPVTLGFSVCLTGSCAGAVNSKFSISSSFKGVPLNIADVALGNDWGFAASTSASFSGDDKVGSSWGGLKGSFSGDVTLGISSASGLTVESDVRVKAYLGAGGSWSSLGTYSADLDLSGPGFRFCKSLKGKRICIP